MTSGVEDPQITTMVSALDIGSIREILFEKVEQLKTNPTEEAYKEVLFQQNKLLETLTARLGDRDETVMQLQEELETYDRIHF